MNPQPGLRQAGPYMTLGIQLALTVLVFFFIGRWLDSLWNTGPWMMVALTLAGSIGALIKFFMTVIQLGKREENEWKADKNKPDA